jgi:hypothetical protein
LSNVNSAAVKPASDAIDKLKIKVLEYEEEELPNFIASFLKVADKTFKKSFADIEICI